MARAARRLRGRLADGPLLRRDIEALLGKEAARGVGLWLDLVRVPPLGTWERRRADLYGLAEDWLPPVEMSTGRRGRARGPQLPERLRARRRRATSPTGRASSSATSSRRWSGWSSGASAARTATSCSTCPTPRSPTPDTPAPVRFLPVWDATLLVHARRTQILPEELRPRVFSIKLPHGVSTFLVDGAVAGAWRLEEGRVVLEPFVPLDAATRRAVEDEGERLAAFAH